MGTVDPMTSEHLLDYALNQLEDPDREAAERELADDPALSSIADRLGLAIHRLADDGASINPPVGLASRTVAFVADRTARRAILDFVPARVPFRWADVAVAAGVLLAGVLTLIPAVNASRNQAAQAGCGFNLQQLGLCLANYATSHDHYPDVCTKGAGTHVGAYAIALKDEDFLRDPRTLHCPCSGECPPMDGPGRPDPNHIDYAYNVGNRQHGESEAEPIRLGTATTIPLLADQPPHENRAILPGNSPNHGFRGQNVLFSDLHVEWFPTRRVKLDRDLFLNDQNRPEPGIGPIDSALVPAVFRIETR
jgi:hypothetical protein